jgi:hypothetical protein
VLCARTVDTEAVESSVQLARGIKPGTPVLTTVLNRTLAVMPSRISRMASSGRVEISKFS